MKAWFISLCLVALTAAAYHWRQPLREQLIGQQPLISNDDWKAQRAELIFRGFQLPKDEITHQLTVLKQVRYHRLLDEKFTANVTTDFEIELKNWRRQWETDAARQQRLLGQFKSEQDMELSMKEALLDRAWIEQQIRAESKVSEAEIQTAFHAQREHLRIAEAYRVAHLFLSAHQPNRKDRAQEITQLSQQMTQGATWDEMVKKHSEDSRSKAHAGHLGWVSAQRMPVAFIKAVQRLKVGELSPPVRTPLGWHLIRLLEKQPSRLPALDEVKNELETMLIQERRKVALDKLIQRLLHGHPGTIFENDRRH